MGWPSATATRTRGTGPVTGLRLLRSANFGHKFRVQETCYSGLPNAPTTRGCRTHRVAPAAVRACGRVTGAGASVLFGTRARPVDRELAFGWQSRAQERPTA